MSKTVAQASNTIAMLDAIQRSMTSNDTFVTFDHSDGEGNLTTYRLPSYESMNMRLNSLEETINSLVTGKGSVNLNDGTRRTISISSVPKTPERITGLSDPSTFSVDSNWFFEDFMFPYQPKTA